MRHTAGGRITCLVLVSLAVITIIGGVWEFRANDKSLMRRAHLVAHLQGWQDFSRTEPQWISDHEVLYLAYRKDGDRFEFMHLDSKTGVQTPMTALNDEFEGPLKAYTFATNHGHEINHEPPEIAISPLRNCLLIASIGLESTSGNFEPVVYYTSDLNAMQEISWQGTLAEAAGYPPHWLSDGKRWFIRDDGPPAPGTTVFDVSHPGSTIRIGDNCREPANWAPISATSNDRLWGVVLKPGPIDENTISAADCDILCKSPTTTHGIKTPVPGDVYLEAFSPKHNRVAWLIYYPYTPLISRLIHRFIPALSVPKAEEYGVWVSDLDGRNMFEVGHDHIPGEWPVVNTMQWLPGEKAISFTIHGELYTVPVNN